MPDEDRTVNKAWLINNASALLRALVAGIKCL